jgi:predicted ATPase
MLPCTLAHRMTRIVITGGPGAGKTVITQRLATDHPDRYIAVPEAATQIYTALNTRWDKLDLEGKHDAQRRMYFLQLDQEQRLAAAHPNQILLLDRGTLDGAAYWPEGPADFWRNVGSTPEKELARYDAVIMLETCATLGLYDHDASNPVRFEDPPAAIAAQEKLLALWSSHPNLHHVAACAQMEDKIRAVLRLLERLNAL